MSKEETKYNKIVNFDKETREITVLDRVFKHSDDFKGATGSKFEPVTEEDIQDRIGNLEGNDTELLCYFADNFGDVTAEQIRYVDSSRDALIELFFDLSHIENHDDIIEELGLENVEFLNCIGGGRCFDENFQGNINPELSKIIREYETKL